MMCKVPIYMLALLIVLNAATVWANSEGWPEDFVERIAPADQHFVQVSAGAFHTCGLLSNGSIDC